MSSLTTAYIRECLDYDPKCGSLMWRRRPRIHFKTEGAWKLFLARHAGRVAGSLDAYGYQTVKINGKRYKAHRIAWALIKGIDFDDVPSEIDHINLRKNDNRADNLRPATGSENCSNTAVRADNSSGHKGVDFHSGNDKWRARIMKNGKSVFLGWFNSVEEAAAAGVAAEQLPHPQGGKVRARPSEEKVEAAKKSGEKPPLGLWMPGSVTELENLIIDGRIRLRQNPVLMTALMGSTFNHPPDPHGNRWFVKTRASVRIDAAVALAMAIGAAVDKPTAEPENLDDFINNMVAIY